MTDPAVTDSATVRDDDSTIFLNRIQEEDGTTSVALWGTEDSQPDIALTYTLVSETTFIEFLRSAGYVVARGDAA